MFIRSPSGCRPSDPCIQRPCFSARHQRQIIRFSAASRTKFVYAFLFFPHSFVLFLPENQFYRFIRV
jgi:hypothetical protein